MRLVLHMCLDKVGIDISANYVSKMSSYTRVKFRQAYTHALQRISGEASPVQTSQQFINDGDGPVAHG